MNKHYCEWHGDLKEYEVLALSCAGDETRFFCIACIASVFAREGVTEFTPPS